MKIVFLICLMPFVATTWGQTTTSPEMVQFMTMVQTTVESLFQRADLNHNGQFDMSDLSGVFTEYDLNGDHQVTVTEFVDRFANNSALLMPVGRGLFFDLDADRNGYLDTHDTQLYFDKIDQNDDGRVDHQEFTDYFTQLFQVLFIIAIRGQQAAAGN